MTRVTETGRRGLRSGSMRWPVALLLVASSLAFVASSMIYAFAPGQGVVLVAPLLDLNPSVNASDASLLAMARPEGGALKLLLACVWLAVTISAVRTMATLRAPAGTPAAAPRAAPVTASVALLAAALWPWAAELAGRGAAFGLVLVMAAAAIWAAIKRRQRRAPGPAFTGTLEFFAGWATVALYSSFAALLILDLGVSPALAAVVSILLLMGTSVEVQLRLGNTVAYGFAVIWALIGIAAGAMQSELTVATAAIVAIAALVAVIVRVLS